MIDLIIKVFLLPRKTNRQKNTITVFEGISMFRIFVMVVGPQVYKQRCKFLKMPTLNVCNFLVSIKLKIKYIHASKDE